MTSGHGYRLPHIPVLTTLTLVHIVLRVFRIGKDKNECPIKIPENTLDCQNNILLYESVGEYAIIHPGVYLY